MIIENVILLVISTISLLTFIASSYSLYAMRKIRKYVKAVLPSLSTHELIEHEFDGITDSAELTTAWLEELIFMVSLQGVTLIMSAYYTYLWDGFFVIWFLCAAHIVFIYKSKQTLERVSVARGLSIGLVRLVEAVDLYEDVKRQSSEDQT